ncbi:MAG: histidine triad nucleotide-binding protein [Clostridia bacterium]|nr:histidine triad nucleotide-binding protein [Clostridia bacterium]
MEDCIFCKIANGEIGSLIYENEYVAAFDDLNPQAPVHSLIVPKKHIENIEALESEDEKYVVEIFKAIKEVAKLKGVSESGYRIISNCGKDAGQTVMHLHFHLLAGKELSDKIL